MLKWIVSITLSISLLTTGTYSAASTEGAAIGNNSTASTSCFKDNTKEQKLGIADWVGVVALDMAIGMLAARANSGPPQHSVTEAFISLEGSNTQIKRGHVCDLEFSRLLENNENMLDAGKVLFENACYDEALIIFKELVRCYPDNSDAHYSIARIYSIKNKRKPAVTELRKAIRLNEELKINVRNDIYLKSLGGYKHFESLIEDQTY